MDITVKIDTITQLNLRIRKTSDKEFVELCGVPFVLVNADDGSIVALIDQVYDQRGNVFTK